MIYAALITGLGLAVAIAFAAIVATVQISSYLGGLIIHVWDNKGE